MNKMEIAPSYLLEVVHDLVYYYWEMNGLNFTLLPV